MADRKLRIAVVTETYPPEINGVAMTISRMVEGLRLTPRGRTDTSAPEPRRTARKPDPRCRKCWCAASLSPAIPA